MDPITQYLSTLGPWGMLAALAVGIVVPKLLAAIRSKMPGTTAPQTTAPTAPQFGPILTPFVEAIRARIRLANPNADPDQVFAAHLYSELNYGCMCNPPDPQPTGVGGIPH